MTEQKHRVVDGGSIYYVKSPRLACPKCGGGRFRIYDTFGNHNRDEFHCWTCDDCHWYGTMHNEDYGISNWLYTADEEESGWVLPDWVVVHQDQGRLL